MIRKVHLVSLPIDPVWSGEKLRADLPPSAVEALRASRLLLVESAKTAKKAIELLGLPWAEKSLVELPERPSPSEAREIARSVFNEQGGEAALFSEAGSPVLADPGGLLCEALSELGVDLVYHAGPTAIIAALSVCGMAVENFYFAGFLSRKDGDRDREIRALSSWPTTLVFFEAPYRIGPFLDAVAKALSPQRRAALVFEAGSPRQTVLRGKLGELKARDAEFRKAPFALVVDRPNDGRGNRR